MEAIFGAIIGGFFTIIAALIPIIYSSRKKKDRQHDDKDYVLDYDINDDNNFEKWVYYKNPLKKSISKINENGLGFSLFSDDISKLGVNKTMNFIKGKVEFEYKVFKWNERKDNLIIYVIPMQENSFDKYGLIEVGTKVQNHPENSFSPFRERYVLKINNENEWEKGAISFDFSNTPDAFYSIFAPRINEGCPNPDKGEFRIRNIKTYRKIK